MVFSKSELSYRASLSESINAICNRHGMVVYGSFSTGNFHLDVDNNQTFSDLDLICERRIPERAAENIRKEILDVTGLEINVSIRGNRKHIDSLPQSVSRNLAAVETTLTFYSKEQITDEYYDYLLSKYFLRTLYANVYFIRNLLSSIKSSRNLQKDPLFMAITYNKLRGDRLPTESIGGMSRSKLVQEKEILDGLEMLCTTNCISDVYAYWGMFIASLTQFQLPELACDISHKIDKVLQNPTRRFNSNTQTRRSLLLTLGLAESIQKQ